MNNLEDIKVSVIVAIYKVAPYLDQLIQSVLHQTHQNLEIILVDDGSPDECGEICDKYAALDSRIIVIHKPNGGGCEARNRGLEVMTGEWFTIIDGDDWLEPDFVDYLLNNALQLGVEMSMIDTCFTSSDNRQVEKDNIEKWSGEKAVTEILSLRIPMGCWNKLYKTEMIRRNNLKFSVPWHGEGMYFCTMAAQYAKFLAKGHRRVYHYRTDNLKSSSKMYNVQNGINGLWNIKNLYHILPFRGFEYKKTIKWHIWASYNFFLRQIVATKSYRKYWREYLSCRIMILCMLPTVIIHGNYNTRQKWSMLKHSVFPVRYAKKMVELKQN